jgi:putative N6-adenine-specific DNA methylase
MNLSSGGPNLNEGLGACQAKPAPVQKGGGRLTSSPTDQGPPNLARRIKRQAWAPQWDWFAVCAPGLEKILGTELKDLSLKPFPAETGEGGVAFQGKLEAGYLANLWLRSAGRVLMRLADFRVRTWDDLVRQAGTIAWEAFLPAGAALSVRVTLKNSNLKHSGRVAEEVFKAASRSLQKAGLAPPRQAKAHEQAQAILVRGVDRRCQISLDASGEHLHKRGYREAPGKAPLREDLAAALLQLAGYDGKELLLDPMCGAGTLPIEAALMARNLPALGERSIAMQAWPCHREPTWRHLLAKAAQEALAAAPSPILGRDLGGAAIKAAAANAQRAGVGEDLRLEQADFFTAPPPPGPPGLLVMNPPYGKRLGSVRQAEAFIKNVSQHLSQAYGGWRMGIVLYLPQWLEVLGLQDPRIISAPFGGVKVTLAAGRVPR